MQLPFIALHEFIGTSAGKRMKGGNERDRDTQTEQWLLLAVNGVDFSFIFGLS